MNPSLTHVLSFLCGELLAATIGIQAEGMPENSDLPEISVSNLFSLLSPTSDQGVFSQGCYLRSPDGRAYRGPWSGQHTSQTFKHLVGMLCMIRECTCVDTVHSTWLCLRSSVK